MSKRSLRVLFYSQKPSLEEYLVTALFPYFEPLAFKRVSGIKILLREIRALRYDLLLIDATMKGLDDSLCERTKTEDCPPRLLYSEASDTQVRLLSARLGCYGVVTADDIEAEDLEGIILNIVDSGREVAEERSLQSQYEQIFELIGESAGVIDARGRVLVANPAICRMVDIPAEKLVGMSLADLIDLSSQKRVLRALPKLAAGESNEYDIVPKYPPGKVLRVKATPLHDKRGRFRGAVLVGHDITEEREREKYWRERESQYRTLVRQLPRSAFLVFDTRLRYTLADGELLDQLGIDAKSLVGAKTGASQIESAGEVLPKLYEEALKGKSTRTRSVINERIYQIRVNPIYDKQGKIDGGAALIMDVSAETRAETSLQAQYTLGQAINSTDSVDEVFNEWMRSLTTISSLTNVAAYRWDDDRKSYTMVVSKGFSPSSVRRLRTLDEKHLLTKLAVKGEFRFSIPKKTREIVEEALGQKSGLTPKVLLPIKVDGKVAAFLLAVAVSTRKISESLHDPLIATADMVAQFMERLQIQVERQRYATYLRNIADSQSDMIVRVAPDGRFTFVNDAYMKAFGKSREELLGTRFAPLVHEDDIAATLAEMEKLKDPPHRVTIQQRALTVRGWRWLEWQDFAVIDDDGEIIEIQGVGRDITESKLAQEQLRASREQLQLILDGAQLGTWDINLKTGFATRNKRWAEMLGYAPNEIPPTREAWDDLIHPEDLPKAQAIIEDHLAGKLAFTLIEHRLRMKSGEWKWVQSWGKVVEWDSEGRPLRAAGTHFDIDSRKQYEQDLRASEMRLSEAQRIAKLGNWDWDLKDQSIYWSDETFRILGYKAGEITPSLKNFLTHIISGDRERVQASIEQAVAKKQSYQIEFSVVTRSDDHKIIRLTSELQYDEQQEPIRMVGTVQDITDQRMAEKALRESEELLEEAQRIAHLGHWSWNLKENVISWSDETHRIMGYQPGEIKPTYDFFISHIHPEDASTVRRVLEGAIENEEAYALEHRVITKHGVTRYVQEQAAIVRDEFNEAVRLIGTIQDITDRKHAEEALRESDARLERVVRGANLGTWYWDISTGQNIVNEQWANLVGRDLSELSFDDKMWREAVYPDDIDRVLAALNDHLEGRSRGYEAEYRMVRSDGRVFWVRDRGSIVSRASDGKPLRVAGTLIDIDARKRAEEAVRQSEERFRMIWDTMVDGIITITPDGIIQGVNPAAEIIFGWASEEVIGRNIKLLMPEPYSSSHDGYLKDYREKGVRRIIGVGREVVGLHKNGSTFPMDLAINEMKIDDQVYLTGIVRDITERKLISAQLRESEERYRMLAEHSTDLITKHDPAGNFTYVSPSAQTLLGYEPEELIGMLSMEIVHPEDLPLIMETIEDGYGRDEIFTISYRVKRKDGRYTWFETTRRLIKDDQNQIVEILGMSRDVTERKFAETQLREASEELRKAYEETARAYRAAEQANDAKSEFLASMSHEIRTPMTAILGFSKLLRQRVEDQESKRFVENMVSSGEHLLDLINDVLDISRVEAGRLKLSPEPLDLQKLIDEIVQLFQPLASEKGLELSLEQGTLPPRVMLDRQRIRQVITNLLGNAVKFTRSGSVVLAVDSLPESNGIEIRVADTGPGISQEVQERVFEPFYQVEQVGQDSKTGTGLGLAITMRLVQQMGGTLSLESALGVGSTFTAHVPCRFVDESEVQALPAETEEVEVAEAGESLSVLVADDHEPNRLLIEHILRSHGHEPVMVTNGREAVDAFGEKAFDRVILDVQMPVMGGFEAIREIRSVPGGEWVPIMTLTAFAMRGDKLKSLEAGADDYLAKPFDPDELLRKVVGLTRSGGKVEQEEAETESASPAALVEDPALLELKRLYLTSVVDEVQQHRTNSITENELRGWAHRIAGSGGSFGYPELTRLAREIEHMEAFTFEETESRLIAIEEIARTELERAGG